ncbi:ParB/RepB/Spo0J family partition protein [Serinicoccus sp. LYQ131]|uniref:ParB/RepB/Spo0J family partition protein n=1 Tax=Serinicoccus sp. LYQ131 TaxID=3378797 RepID=UPI0038537420
MTERRRGLGKGLGALIPQSDDRAGADRPRDVFFPRSERGSDPRVTGDLEGTRSAEGFTGNIAADAGTDADAGADAHSAAPSASGQDRPGHGDGAHAQNGEQSLAPVPGATFAEIPVEDIRANPRQPRAVFDEDDLAELVASISEIGVLQPVVVRMVSEADISAGQPPFELVMGERRLRASRQAGNATIPAIVRVTDDEHMLRDALLENLHRAQLNPLEEAAAYQQLLEDFGCTHDELASRIGRSRPQISNTIRLLRLPPMVQRRVASGVLSAGHARALLGLEDGAAMERLAQRIVAEGLSVRSVEEIVTLGADDAPTTRNRSTRPTPAPELQSLAERLAGQLDTRVQVSMGRRKGKMVIEFAGTDDLQRILDLLQRD